MYVVHLKKGADFLCRAIGEPLASGEALSVIWAAVDQDAPPQHVDEQAAKWTASTTNAEHVTCPACKRVLARSAAAP